LRYEYPHQRNADGKKERSEWTRRKGREGGRECEGEGIERERVE